MVKVFFSTLFFIASIILSCPAVSSAGIFKKNAVVMGTDLEITVSVHDQAKADEAFAAVISEMERLEDMMSEWRDGTYVSEINKSAGVKAIAVPDELFNVIVASRTISDLSGGAFDISWAAMRGVWDFRPGHQRVPTPEEVRERLPLVNYKNIILDNEEKKVFLKNSGMNIGLGAIAKGFAVDKAMQVLAKRGIKDAIVRAGGDMRVQGTSEGSPWEIGIKHPRNKELLLAKLPLTNISISTSGDYERFFIKDGVLYHHIMNPRTGYPAKDCRSVTILAHDTTTSDALSTAVFVLGPKTGMELVKRLKGVEAIIVDASGEIHTSPGITLKGK